MSAIWPACEWINRGGERIATDPSLASRLIRQGLKLDPTPAIGWFNLGLAYHQQRKIEAAIRAYQHALVQDDAPRATITRNLGQDLLLAEHWAAGWEVMEERSQMRGFDVFLQALGPSWSGPDDPAGAGQGLLVVSEQGLGDTLMFARFAVLLQRQGLAVKLLCQPALVELLMTCSELRHVEALRKPMTSERSWRWVPLMSLPKRLNWLQPPWPCACDWLNRHADVFVKRQAHWREVLGIKPERRLIGLHWQGNPKHEGSLYSRDRSIPLRAWEGLQGPGNAEVEFIALQKGDGLEQWSRSSRLAYVAGQERFNQCMSMLDSAAVISLCDTVISADSGVVHLGGSLGTSTWVALRRTPDWRWGLQGSQTLWYSSLTLFRQPVAGDWGHVVQAMARQLST